MPYCIGCGQFLAQGTRFCRFCGSPIVFEVPGRFRKVREDAGIHVQLVSSKSEPGGPSYDPKTNFSFF